MKPLPILLLFAAFATLLPAANSGLTVYVIDVEGGQSTLFVTAAGQSILVDTGFPGFAGRDAGRIAAAAKDAGLRQIDYLLITHFHGDHAGGVPALAELLPIRNFVDHGDTVEQTVAAQQLYKDYRNIAAKGHRNVVRPGETLPVKELDWTIVSAAGLALTDSLPGAGQPNPFCSGVAMKGADATENAQSVGSIIAYGRFRMADLGDLTWDKEQALVCPANKLGTVDVLLVSHHGMDISNSPSLVHALAPKVALIDNGEKKGGIAAAWDVVRSSPGLLDIWQSHFATAAGTQHNADEKMIANPASTPDAGHYLKLHATADGHFEITNSRNSFSKEY